MDERIKRLNSAMECSAAGLRIVLLHPKKKRPIGKAWGTKATIDEDDIADRFDKDPDANIGVLLGPYPAGDTLPGVIDIEFDTEEGKKTAERLFGDDDGVVTPTYTSRRSVHRLFRWSSDMPPIQKMDIDGLEVRIGGGSKQTQSVLPPSVFVDEDNGNSVHNYTWVPGLSIDDVEIADVPDCIAARLCNVEVALEANGLTAGSFNAKPPEYFDEIREGVSEGGGPSSGRNNALTSMVGKWLTMLTEIDSNEAVATLRDMAHGWAAKCSPPLPPKEVDAVVTNILKRERKRRENEASDDMTFARPIDDQVGAISEAEIEAVASDETVASLLTIHKAEIVQSDPPTIRIYSKSFNRAWKSRVEMPLEDISYLNRVADHIIRQAFCLIPPGMRKKGVWVKKVGELVQQAQYVSPDMHAHRPAMIAEAIVSLSGNCSRVPFDDIKNMGISGTGIIGIEPSGYAMHLPSLVRYLKEVNRCVDAIKRTEVVRLLTQCGAQDEHTRSFRFWVVSEESMDKIKIIFMGS